MNKLQERVVKAGFDTINLISQNLEGLGFSKQESLNQAEFLFNIPNDKYKDLPIVYQKILQNAYQNIPDDFKKLLSFFNLNLF